MLIFRGFRTLGIKGPESGTVEILVEYNHSFLVRNDAETWFRSCDDVLLDG